MVKSLHHDSNYPVRTSMSTTGSHYLSWEDSQVCCDPSKAFNCVNYQTHPLQINCSSIPNTEVLIKVCTFLLISFTLRFSHSNNNKNLNIFKIHTLSKIVRTLFQIESVKSTFLFLELAQNTMLGSRNSRFHSQSAAKSCRSWANVCALQIFVVQTVRWDRDVLTTLSRVRYDSRKKILWSFHRLRIKPIIWAI